MAGRGRQRGISLITLVFFLAVIGVLGAVGMKAFPSMVEYQAALKAINKAREAGSIVEVRNAFDRAAQVDDIRSIAGKDLEVVQNGDQMQVSFAYDREFHLIGPAWLTLKYTGTSRPGR